jgi:3-ketosteroid 9alpha-monooxygenase subunit B
MTDVKSTPSATSGPRSALLTVADVIVESEDTHSLVLTIPDAELHRFAYCPGQFLAVRIPSAQTGSVARCYSLASSPHTGEAPKLTIKRTDGG